MVSFTIRRYPAAIGARRGLSLLLEPHTGEWEHMYLTFLIELPGYASFDPSVCLRIYALWQWHSCFSGEPFLLVSGWSRQNRILVVHPPFPP